MLYSGISRLCTLRDELSHATVISKCHIDRCNELLGNSVDIRVCDQLCLVTFYTNQLENMSLNTFLRDRIENTNYGLGVT